MTPVALWALSAHAASVDLAHPEMLTAQMARALVDLSAIESATMTVWFDGPFAPNMILGESGAEALLEYVRKSGAKNNALKNAEATRLVAAMRFDVQVVNKPRQDIAISIPTIRWGEIEAFAGRPNDDAVRENALNFLNMGPGFWAMFHISGADRNAPDDSILEAVETPTGIALSFKGDETFVVELARDTFVPIAMRDAEWSVGLQFVKSGEKYLLAHVDGNLGGQPFGRVDMTFAEIDGVPWPRDAAWRMGTAVLETMHLGDVVLEDNVAPFLPGRATMRAAPSATPAQ